MYKIALCGKANSGKNTAANLLLDHLTEERNVSFCTTMAFADPIKEMIKIMFPHVKKKHLYGSSSFRNTLIKGAIDKQGNPLTIRQALIEVGTGMGRAMNNSIWLDVFDHRFANAQKRNDAVVVTDVRFPNEFEHLRNQGFFLIKIIRDSGNAINHATETTQDTIPLSDFHYVLKNDSSLDELQSKIVMELDPILMKLQSLE